MICNVCGRNIENENAHFCENCGTRLNSSDTFSYQKENVISKEAPVVPNLNTSDTIPFKTFLGVMLLQVVPYIGIFVYIVVLFSWVFGNKYSKTHKNYAKAALVMLLLSLVASAYALSSGLFTLPT